MKEIEILKAAAVILGGIAGICYLYQIFYLVIPFLHKGKEKASHSRQLRYGVLIAARNEEAVLPHLLDSIRSQQYPADRITTFVVADNCTDGTARVAAEHGAIVYERFDTSRVGKGYALHFLIQKLRQEGYLKKFDAFLVFDADNLLDKDYVNHINRLPNQGYSVFCGFRNTKNFGTNWITSGYGMWYLHESAHMNHSRHLIGSCACVNGTGFGFTRELLETLGDWKFFTLTEDIEFNNWCAANGMRIGYCHEAVVYDEQPETFSQSWRQRTRWTQGGIQVSLRYGGAVARGVFRGGWQGYACFELLTLSLWGMALPVLSMCLGAAVTILTVPPQLWICAAAMAILGTYGYFLVVGAWTMLTERRKVLATPKEKLWGVVTFPLFMMTFAPIAATAVFRKFHWHPIAHTVAISREQLQETGK